MGSCIWCSETLILTHPAQASFYNRSQNILSHHFVFRVAPHANCFEGQLEHSRLAWEHPTSDLEADRQLFPRAISASFFSSAFPRLTGYPESCEEFCSLLGLRITRLMGLAFARIAGRGFAIGELSCEVASWPLFLRWRSAFQLDRQKGVHWNGYKKTSRKSQCWTNKEDDSIRLVKKLPLVRECLRVGFWCQHI